MSPQLGVLVVTDDELELAVSLVVTSISLAGGKFWITSELLNPQELPTANRGHRLIGPDGIPVMTWTGRIGWPGTGENGGPLRAVYVTQDLIITGEPARCWVSSASCPSWARCPGGWDGRPAGLRGRPQLPEAQVRYPCPMPKCDVRVFVMEEGDGEDALGDMAEHLRLEHGVDPSSIADLLNEIEDRL